MNLHGSGLYPQLQWISRSDRYFWALPVLAAFLQEKPLLNLLERLGDYAGKSCAISKLECETKMPIIEVATKLALQNCM